MKLSFGQLLFDRKMILHLWGLSAFLLCMNLARAEEHGQGKETAHESASKDSGHTADTHATEAHQEASASAHGEGEKEPPVPIPTDPKELIQILKNQIESQPIEVLRGIVDKIISQAPPSSAEGHEAVGLLRQALLSIARRSAELDNHSEAILYYERWRAYALQQDEFDPNTAAVLVEIGREYRKIGSPLTAIETFYRAMTIGRQSSADSTILKMARWEVAETTYMMKNWDRARRLFDMFVDAEGENDILRQTAFYRMGDCWRALGDDNQMIVSYEQGIANNDKHPYAPEARIALMNALYRRENYLAASRILNQFVRSISEMAPNDASYWKRRSGEMLFRFLFETHKFDTALEILQGLEKIDPNSEEWQQQVSRWKGLVYIEKKDWEKAVHVLAPPIKKEIAAAATPPPAPAEGATPANTEGGAAPATTNAAPAKVNVAISNETYRDLSQWIGSMEKRKSDLQLPTQPPNP